MKQTYRCCSKAYSYIKQFKALGKHTTTKSTIYIGYFTHTTSVTRRSCSPCRKKLMRLQQRLSTTVLECNFFRKKIIFFKSHLFFWGNSVYKDLHDTKIDN